MPTPSRRTSSLRPVLRRLAERVLETPDLDALTRLLTRELPGALRLPGATLLVWDRKLERFQAVAPGETHVHPISREHPEPAAEQPRWLISEGVLLETPGIRANVPIWGIDAGDGKNQKMKETTPRTRN